MTHKLTGLAATREDSILHRRSHSIKRPARCALVVRELQEAGGDCGLTRMAPKRDGELLAADVFAGAESAHIAPMLRNNPLGSPWTITGVYVLR